MTESRRTNDAVSALDDIKTLKESGFRFCGICADDNGDGYDVMYFLADEKELRRLEYRVGRGDPIESVTYVYEHALAQEIGAGYDIIVANIVADVIIGMAPMFADKLVPSGHLICSGILNERADEVRAALEANGFAVLSHECSEDWSAFTAKR